MQIHSQKYINDGGQIDPDFIKKMPEGTWNEIVEKFFPHQDK